MAYFATKCGGLRMSSSDFALVDGVVTSATMGVDTFTPTYSTGVSAKFDADKYADEYGKNDTTFTATVADLLISWSDGTDTLTDEDMADIGFTNIVGVVDGSTIAVDYKEEQVPRTELVGDAFNASACGGQKFDDGVFAEVKIGKTDVITTAGTSTASAFIKANCSLPFDASKFDFGADGEIVLK